MDKEREEWIVARAEAIMTIAESRTSELASAMQTYMDVVRSSDMAEKREKARTKPLLFAHDALRGVASVIAYGEYEAGKDPYDDDALIGRINDDLIQSAQYIAMHERPRGGRTH